MQGSVPSCYISWLFFLETPTGVELGRYHLLELFLTQEAPVWRNRRLLYLLVFTSCDPNLGRVGQLSQYWSCFCHKKLLRGAVAGWYISSSLLHEIPTGIQLGSYSLIEFFLSHVARAGISTKLLYLLVVTSWDSNRGGLGKVSPLRAVIDTGSSCVAQS